MLDVDDRVELERLRDQAQRPRVIELLSKVLQESQNLHQKEMVREPIQRAVAQPQTIYITSGYGWGQSSKSVTIYLNLKNALSIKESQYELNVQPRSISLDIRNHMGANHNFRISQLHDHVKPDATQVKLKENKMVIYLAKATPGKDWTDLRLKSTRDMYDELRRAESTTAPLPHPQGFGNNVEDLSRELYRNSNTATQQAIQKTLQDPPPARLNPFAPPGTVPDLHVHAHTATGNHINKSDSDNSCSENDDYLQQQCLTH
ncbi:hypothetical protein BCR43DRAFT_487013 [Syncephalastrum racemosum]|uniref:CS domain-containing protein n=1 Tax=Syncephalastrum racemosum TaxID=13706 RepID=A0A1X2HQ35_SYNRA|nr:hypothetical protein BCR43DRAFT_487013 [Syncephalastrum racemosum]